MFYWSNILEILLVRGGKNCEHLFFIKKNDHKFLELYEGSGALTLSIGLVLRGI